MRDRAVLDSGVIFALYFEEDASQRAIDAVDLLSPITLDLAVAEVGNAAWKRVALFKESKDSTRASLSKCLEFIKSCRVILASDLAELAYEIALENKTTFYDSLFLAAAEREEVTLLTLDRKMCEKARATINVQMI
jgi:predicted nucleic acid-binding protein